MPSKVKDYQNRYKFPRRQRFMEFSAAFGDMSGPGTLAALPGTESLRVGHSGVEGPEVGRIASHTLQNPLLGVAVRAPVGGPTKVGYGFRKGPTGTTVQEEETTGIYQPAANESAVVSAGAENVHYKSSETVFNDPGVNNMNVRMEGDGATQLFVANSGVDAVQIGNTVAGEIADFRNVGVVINESGADRDFRIESAVDTHGIFVQGSDGKVGIAQDTPAESLDVVGNTLASGDIKWKSGTANTAEQVHANSAARTYTFPNKSGTVALLDDITSGAWVDVLKVTNETVTKDTTLTADAALVFTVPTSGGVAFQGSIFFETGATGDFKFRLVNAGAAEDLVRFKMTWIVAGGITEVDNAVQTAFHAGDQALVGAGGAGWIEFDGIILASSKGDVTAQFQWAQNVSDATDTTVYGGSHFRYRTIA